MRIELGPVTKLTWQVPVDKDGDFQSPEMTLRVKPDPEVLEQLARAISEGYQLEVALEGEAPKLPLDQALEDYDRRNKVARQAVEGPGAPHRPAPGVGTGEGSWNEGA